MANRGSSPLGRTLKANLIGPTLTKVGVRNIKTDRLDKFGPQLMKHECLRSRTGGGGPTLPVQLITQALRSFTRNCLSYTQLQQVQKCK